MSQHISDGASTLPRDFRFHHEEPRTPEPSDNGEVRQPSPPRQRLKIKKRVALTLQAPTQQFLASVAAADMPIPTIETEQYDIRGEDFAMIDREDTVMHGGFLAPGQFDTRALSPPKTPMIIDTEELKARLPDWSMGTPSPIQEEFFPPQVRPTSSQSNASDSTEDSFYSGSRHSRRSDDGNCTSPESEIADPFQFPNIKGKAKVIEENPFRRPEILNGRLRSKTLSNAPWSQAQSEHLWATYLIYLQDPTVTPFRIGASAIPPEGVCCRVAREAQKSWRGPKIDSGKSLSNKSGSITPTAEALRIYAQWPHSSAATRGHLRELCKRKEDNFAVSHHRHGQSRSPTPFTNSHVRTQSERSFNVRDMSFVLTTSTATSMQPDGPLAKLAASRDNDSPIMKSTPSSAEDFRPLSFGPSRGFAINRLGSPFAAHTYGPSSSKMFNHEVRPSVPRMQSDSGPRLGSPLILDESRSLNGTQKRRAQNDLEEELSPNGAIVRPSILNLQLFGTPLNGRRVRSRGYSLGDEAFQTRSGVLFQPVFDHVSSQPMRSAAPAADLTPTAPAATLLPPTFIPPPRLGSPFSENKSQTFPRRLFPEGTTTIRRSAFATMHQSRRSIESFDFGEGMSLQSRLERMEGKLRLIREREAGTKAQQSSA